MVHNLLTNSLCLRQMKKAFVQLHIAVFLAGFTAILGKLITLNEIVLVWYRLLITVVSMGLWLYFSKQLQILKQKEAKQIFWVAQLVALHWLAFYASIKYANISVALTCLSALGFFTAIFEPLFFKRKADGFEIFLGLLAIAGIYLIFNFYPQYKVGIGFGVASAALAGIFPILNKELLNKHSATTLTVYEMGSGFLGISFLMPFYLHFFPAQIYFPSMSDWLWLFVLAWLCTILGFLLQLNALKKISAFTSNLTYNLEPVYGIVLAFIIFHENKYFTSAFYLGLSLILLAVVLQTARVYSIRKKKKLEVFY